MRAIVAGLTLLGSTLVAVAEAGAGSRLASDGHLDAFFRAETERLAARQADAIRDRATWEARRPELRRQLLDMLGLWPLPERTPLEAVVTGQVEHDDFVVEKLHFQSLPGLYVTANLYRPRVAAGRLPAILYACGHAQVKTNGLSCGNKTGYQHHGIWFARHGYVCLLIDTLQLGEIEGEHHGTHRLGKWWWNSRGYTPAGVEAWNAMRAIDYLQSRPEVDADRIGMTGRSGGGSYTWTTAAIDDRIRVAAPVAGITDLRDQVVNGVVEGHCDCMFFVNTHQWDFWLNAALIAPRPLLVVNTDSDPIFPLDGVQRLHERVRQVYALYQTLTNLGLVIAPGPHLDTQDLQVPVFRWFNRHLRGADPLIAEPAVKRFHPLDLRVFDSLPANERNTRADDWFGGQPSRPDPLADPAATLTRLRERSFAAWPDTVAPPQPVRVSETRHAEVQIESWEFESAPGIRLPLTLLMPSRNPAQRMVLEIEDPALGPEDWERRIADRQRVLEQGGAASPAVALLRPRGVVDPSRGGRETGRPAIQQRRRFLLLGRTLGSEQVWDLRRAVQALRVLRPGIDRLDLAASGDMAVHALYAALFEPGIASVRAADLPPSHRDGPDYLNVLQVLDLPDTIELAKRQGIEVVRETTPAERRP